jgi:hypothetical protein
MVQLCARSRFALKAFDKLGVLGDGRRQHFQGNNAIQRFLTRFENSTHAALADFSNQFKAADFFQRQSALFFGEFVHGFAALMPDDLNLLQLY